MKNTATQIIEMNVKATEQTFEKLFDKIFDGVDDYEVTFAKEIVRADSTNGEEFNLYNVTWSISGWTYFCRSNDWYSPDEWDCSESFIFESSEVFDIINSYAREVGIDSDLYDIEDIIIHDIEEIDDFDY